MSKYLSPEERVLQIAAPQVFTKVQNLHAQFPELHGRALRAGFLAVGGAVHPAPGMPDTYHVTSSSGTGDHGHPDFNIVQLDAHGTLHRGTCTCPRLFERYPRVAPRFSHPLWRSQVQTHHRRRLSASDGTGTGDR